jgi:L-2-hydroxycarboxylate dehydrogenase (NAD+)
VLLSTNLIAIAVPSWQRPSIVLDMTTTNTAFGKIRLPKRASEGFLVPIGGPKGYRLALIVWFAGRNIERSRVWPGRGRPHRGLKNTSNTGQAIVAVDIATFADVQAFKQRVDEMWAVMKSSPTLPGVDEVRLPGERSTKLYRERVTHGVPLGAELRKVLDELADRFDIQRLR